MRSQKRGRATSRVEIANISPNGVWINVDGVEYFMPYAEFPWFKDATIKQILNVDLIHQHHLRWPDLDVDLDLDSLRTRENYPLVYR